MKKTTGILTAVAVGVVAYVGATWFMGKQVQDTVEHYVSESNARLTNWMASAAPNLQARWSVAKYRRGVFSSEAVYSLHITDQNDEERTLLFQDRIQHGPLPLKALAAGDFAPVLASSRSHMLATPSTQAWFVAAADQPPISGRTRVQFGGQIASDWQLRPLRINEAGESLEFSGGTVHVQYDGKGADNQLTVALPWLDYALAGDRIVLDDFRLQYLASTAEDIARTGGTVEIAKFTLRRADQEMLALHTLSAQSGGERRGDLLSGYARYDLQQLAAAGTDLGQVSMGLAAQGFSADGAKLFVDVANRLSARYGTQTSAWSLSEDETRQLNSALLATVTAGSTLTLDPFSWKNAQGETGMQMTVGLTPSDISAPQGSMGLALAQAVDTVDARITVDKAMLTHVLSQPMPFTSVDGDELGKAIDALYDEYARRLQMVGLAMENDGVLSASVVYRDGQVNANGRDLPLGEFLQRALMVFFM